MRTPPARVEVLSLLLLLIVYLVSATYALADSSSPKAGEQIKWQVVAAGGNRGSSTNFVLTGTTGQTAVGKGSSTNFGVNQGFQQSFATYICGDANGDASIDISDAVFLIAYIFAGGPAPNPLLAGDANCDLAVDISDAVYLISTFSRRTSAVCGVQVG